MFLDKNHGASLSNPNMQNLHSLLCLAACALSLVFALYGIEGVADIQCYTVHGVMAAVFAYNV